MGDPTRRFVLARALNQLTDVHRYGYLSTLCDSPTRHPRKPCLTETLSGYNYTMENKSQGVGDFLRENGKACNVYCGCIGWAGGHKRPTRGVKADSPKGTRTYFRCDECGKLWHIARSA